MTGDSYAAHVLSLTSGRLSYRGRRPLLVPVRGPMPCPVLAPANRPPVECIGDVGVTAPPATDATGLVSVNTPPAEGAALAPGNFVAFPRPPIAPGAT